MESPSEGNKIQSRLLAPNLETEKEKYINDAIVQDFYLYLDRMTTNFFVVSPSFNNEQRQHRESDHNSIDKSKQRN